MKQVGDRLPYMDPAPEKVGIYWPHGPCGYTVPG